MKLKCIKTFGDSRDILFEEGKIYEGRNQDFQFSNTMAIVSTTHKYSVGFYLDNCPPKYKWKLSDYFISVEDDRDSKIDEIIDSFQNT